MAEPNPKDRNFHAMGGLITGREALRKYPNPRFFMRARASMTVEECRQYLQRNADEAARVVEILRMTATSKSKGPILHAARRLHDFRVSIDIFGGEAGRPYLWEE